MESYEEKVKRRLSGLMNGGIPLISSRLAVMDRALEFAEYMAAEGYGNEA